MEIPNLKSKRVCFRQVLINFGRQLVKALLPIRAKVEAEEKNIVSDKIKSCSSAKLIYKHPFIKNRDKNRWRNWVRAKLLLERWQA